MISEDLILQDAAKGVKKMIAYQSYLIRKQKDGTLAKALHSCSIEYVNVPLNDSIQKFVIRSMILIMQSMGEKTVPQWTIPQGGLSNIHFKRMYDTALHQVEHPILEEELERKAKRQKTAGSPLMTSAMPTLIAPSDASNSE